MIEIGKIYKIKKGNYAVVRFDRKMACDSCNMCLKPREENYVELRVKNTLNAEVGDTIKIQIGNKSFLTAVFIAYLLPLFLFGVALAFSYKLKTIVSLSISFASLLLGFIIVFIIDKQVIRENPKYCPMMLEIVKD